MLYDNLDIFSLHFFLLSMKNIALFLSLFTLIVSNLMQIIKELGCSHWAAALGAFLATFGKNSG